MPIIAKMEELVGTKDGANLVFTTPGGEAYIDGGNVVFWSGLPRVIGNADGWTNSDPANGEITMKEAPEVGDSLQMLYAQTVAGIEAEVTELNGSLVASGDISGILAATTEVAGSLIDRSSLSGILEAVNDVDGAIEDRFGIQGIVEEIL